MSKNNPKIFSVSNSNLLQYYLLISLILIYFPHSNYCISVSLNGDNFYKDIATQNHLVMFYAPWCGHCQRLKTTYEKLAEKYNIELQQNQLTISKIDCTQFVAICSDQDIISYPMLIFYWSHPDLKLRYRGKRNLEDLDDFVQNMIILNKPPDPSTMQQYSKKKRVSSSKEVQAKVKLFELSDENFEEIVSKGYHFISFYAPWCSHCQAMSSAWSQLWESFRDDENIFISKVDCTVNNKVCGKEGIRGYPTLLVFYNGQRIGEYLGDRSYDSFRSYISTIVSSDQEDRIVSKTEKGQKQVLDDEKKDDSDLVADKKNLKPDLDNEDVEDKNDNVEGVDEKDEDFSLNIENFPVKIQNNFRFVKFFVPWCMHCQAMRKDWLLLRKELKDHPTISISQVDCTKYHNLCVQEKVLGYPALFIYYNGIKIFDYKQERSVDTLKKFIISFINERAVQYEVKLKTDEEELSYGLHFLNEDSFEIMKGVTFVFYFLPSCNFCKAMIPVWRELTKTWNEPIPERYQLESSVNKILIATVDCSRESKLCSQQNVNKYPTMVLYRDNRPIKEYIGERTIASFESFMDHQMDIIRQYEEHDEL